MGWGSSAKMVSRILEQEEDIRVVLSADRKTTTNPVPIGQDIDVLQAGEDYVCYSSRLVADIKRRIRTDFSIHLLSYDSNQLLLLQVASFLDP